MTPPAPPTQAGPVAYTTAPSGWPKVIGVISIVLGSLAAVGGCIGTVMQLSMGALKGFLEKVTPKGAGPDPLATWEAMERFAPWTMAVQLLLMAVAILLLIAGIGLVRRRRWSIKAGVVWAVLKILAVVPNAVLTYVTVNAQMEAVPKDPNMQQMPAGLFSMIGSFGGIAAALWALLWGWAYPVFILIWFSRRKIKDEVEGWK